jgi:8-oxo-dGTP pyrophosphatase MutT (NUDIX family)
MDSKAASKPVHSASERTAVRRIAGVALLRDDNSALMQLRDIKPGLNAAGLWVFPGGHCEPGESAESAARREFLEETGYTCDEIWWVGSFPCPSDDRQVMYDLQIFASRYDEVQPVRCYEGQEVAFIPREQASRYPMPQYVPHVWDLAIAVLRRALIGDKRTPSCP